MQMMFNDINLNNWAKLDKKNEHEVRMFFERLIKSPINSNDLRVEIK